MQSHRPAFPAVRTSVLATIGRTPLVALERLSAGLLGLVLTKLGFFHPGHSVKDRIALRMIEDAEQDRRLTSGQPMGGVGAYPLTVLDGGPAGPDRNRRHGFARFLGRERYVD